MKTLGLVVGAVLVLSGCVKEPLQQTWTNSENGNALSLAANGTASLTVGGQSHSGTWHKADGRILVVDVPGVVTAKGRSACFYSYTPRYGAEPTAITLRDCPLLGTWNVSS